MSTSWLLNLDRYGSRDRNSRLLMKLIHSQKMRRSLIVILETNMIILNDLSPNESIIELMTGWAKQSETILKQFFILSHLFTLISSEQWIAVELLQKFRVFSFYHQEKREETVEKGESFSLKVLYSTIIWCIRHSGCYLN